MDAQLRALIDRQRIAATEATEKFMDVVLGQAQRDAPIKEGTLRGSADRNTEVGPEGVTVTGSFSTPYAARQHEELGWRHPKGGKAKYLEDPFKEAAPRLPQIIALAVRRVTPGG